MNIQNDYEKNQKNRKIVKVLSTTSSLAFIFAGIYFAKICQIFNLNISINHFNIYKYGFIGIGLYDLIMLQVLLKYNQRKQKQL